MPRRIEIRGGDDEPVEEVRARLQKAETDVREYLELLQRVQADFANHRRRVEEEREEQARMANASLIERLLPVIDDFGRALEAVPEGQSGQDWVKGVVLIQKKLLSILEQEGLVRVGAEGGEFDPRMHEAVMVEESDDLDEGRVVRVLQDGYRWNDRLLRPARVVVAK